MSVFCQGEITVSVKGVLVVKWTVKHEQFFKNNYFLVVFVTIFKFLLL